MSGYDYDDDYLRFDTIFDTTPDIERLLEIMRQGHEVTMQTFRDMIDRWRHDIDTNHQRFLAEQTARQEARERRREKPIRWQPGVNIWEPNH